MELNVDKCKVLHIGIHRNRLQCLMNYQQLSAPNKEKALGVIISSDLKQSQHCSEVFITANKDLVPSNVPSEINEKKLY